MKRVLAIDGGGLHGILPATVLDAIEIRGGRPIAAQFDLVAGVSTGGLIALALCGKRPMTASQVLALYLERAAEIFPARLLRLPWLVRAKYPARGLERVLKLYLGDAPMRDSIQHVMVAAYDIANRRPAFFKSWRGEATPNWLAARATSAAPAYFPPCGPFIDGGVFANNPALAAAAEAAKLWPHDELLVVSLGCGEHIRRIEPGRAAGWGLAGWAPRILSVFMDGQADAAAHALDHWPGARHVRIQTALIDGSDDFDDSSPENLAALQEDAARMVADHRDVIDTIAKGGIP